LAVDANQITAANGEALASFETTDALNLDWAFVAGTQQQIFGENINSSFGSIGAGYAQHAREGVARELAKRMSRSSDLHAFGVTLSLQTVEHRRREVRFFPTIELVNALGQDRQSRSTVQKSCLSRSPDPAL
jgi:hypothetical protein